MENEIQQKSKMNNELWIQIVILDFDVLLIAI